MRQRLALARTLLHDPELLVLDEPTAGVDPTGQIEIRQVLLDMAHQQGKTIFFSSHNLDEVQRICNRIALIDRGEIKLSGDLAEIERNMNHGEVVIETTEPIPAGVISELRGLPCVTVQSQTAQILKISSSKLTGIPAIVHLLDSRGVNIEQVKKQEASIEDVYSAIVKTAEGR
jgi:ABC-2 type transport system ATP-binding protein